MRRWLYGLSGLAAAALWSQAAPNAQPANAPPEEVDVALVLAVDISYSMDLDELALQRNGYIEAFRSKPLQDAISNGAIGKIAVTYFEWAGGNFQHIVRPWKIIDGPAAANAFAEELGEAPTRRGRRTSISGAIDLGVQLLEQSNVTAMRRVIDISGDGANNDGRPVTAARDEAGAKGIAINGLPVMLKQAGYFDIDNLDVYYKDCVVTGIGAFVIPIREKHQFVEATRTKLLREIAAVPPDATVQKAQAGDPSTCLAGERQWRDRMGN
ncbi:DUF1194 domain-containing protein [Bosea sp. SSUT16]|uniref:DUF1194 domain-containing protein n=1 Tax=Bosea spartocytisi TaxID=2773451 RepID=A0A927E6N7_9HYPH|nr:MULTISPECIES: DUF1194 domain-containing protein [Bosea]MBD3845348.1 DUF1194 domain-containing protein [Bosea spartocytisi]MCT4472518.1 DUF1194 domain-containing protein [Bosea spartocytisi]